MSSAELQLWWVIKQVVWRSPLWSFIYENNDVGYPPIGVHWANGVVWGKERV